MWRPYATARHGTDRKSRSTSRTNREDSKRTAPIRPALRRRATFAAALRRALITALRSPRFPHGMTPA